MTCEARTPLPGLRSLSLRERNVEVRVLGWRFLFNPNLILCGFVQMTPLLWPSAPPSGQRRSENAPLRLTVRAQPGDTGQGETVALGSVNSFGGELGFVHAARAVS